jgi:DNA-binding NarL/FixJ family response regulator
MLEHLPGMQMVGASDDGSDLLTAVADSDPDVVIMHAQTAQSAHWSAVAGMGVPAILIVEELDVEEDRAVGDDWLPDAVDAGVRGILAGSPTAAELGAAVQSAAAGLLVLAPHLFHSWQRGSYPQSTAAKLPAAEDDDTGESVEPLTVREKEVLEMMMEGLSNKEIAAHLNISAHTIKFHISSILGKLGASSRTEATTIGLRRGLITI